MGDGPDEPTPELGTEPVDQAAPVGGAEIEPEASTAPLLPAAPDAPPQPPPAPSYVYALGQVDWRFPSLGIEKEFAQATAGTRPEPDDAGAPRGAASRRARGEKQQRTRPVLTEHQLQSAALAKDENRYIARQLCWVLVIEGLETYILVPRDPSDLDLLRATVRPERRADDIDAIIGVRAQIAPPEMCNGLSVPIVMFDQVYSFDRETLIASIPVPESLAESDEPQFRTSAGELFYRIIHLADNAGAIDEHRALNYLAVRYPRMYAVTTLMEQQNFTFTGIQVLPSPLGGVRHIVDVIFSYTHRQTDVTEKQFVRVDVTEEFPFLVTKMGTYYHT
jgi:PatG C-terminal